MSVEWTKVVNIFAGKTQETVQATGESRKDDEKKSKREKNDFGRFRIAGER